MRLGLLVFALAACSPFGSAKPTWPQASPREADGGESLAPQAAARTVAAVTKAEDDDRPAEAAEKPEAPAPVVTPAAPAAATPSEPTDEELMITEEIVIEIED